MKNNYLTLSSALAFLLFSFAACGQEKKKSPAATAEGKVGNASIVIKYHQPSARGRTMIGGEAVPYGKIWRTGANDATSIDISSDVKIEGKKLSKGKYALFTIPGEKEWTIVFNSNHGQWGAYDYKESEDVLRVKVKADKPAAFVETFEIKVESDGVVLAWENSKVKFGVSE